MQRHCTPGTPGRAILHDTNAKVDDNMHKIYRSGVGLLLHLVKHSCPDILNAVCELTVALDPQSPAAYKEMLCLIKYTIDTGEIKPVESESDEWWTIVVYCDSDFAGNKKT